MMLDELVPWHEEFYNFSLLEVNRYVCIYLNVVYTLNIYNDTHRSPTDVLGFSKETVVTLITNIEGREWHRREVANQGLKPEHPRASTTDNIED